MDRPRLTGEGRNAPFWICAECGNMLMPKEDAASRTLKRWCRHCNKEDTADSNLVLKTDLRKEAHLQEITKETIKDPTLPRSTTSLCASCGHTESVFFQAPTRGDEGMKLIFMCTKCTYQWKQ